MRHHAQVRHAEFSPDGTQILTTQERQWGAGPDGKRVVTTPAQALLWDLPDTTVSLDEIARQTSLATGAQLDADGRIESVPWAEWQAMRDQEATR